MKWAIAALLGLAGLLRATPGLAQQPGRPTIVHLAMVEVAKLPAGTQAQVSDEAWARLSGLSTGVEARVVTSSGASSQGTIQTADAGSITLAIAGRAEKIARGDVREVSIVRRSRRTLMGLVIGAAAGGVALALRCRGESPACKEWMPVYLGAGVGVGSAIGAVLPKKKVWEVVYSR